MSVGYHLSQAWRMARRRFTTGLWIILVTAVATIGVVLTVAGVYGKNIDLMSLSEQVVVTVFLEMDADSLDVLYVREQMHAMPEIANVGVVYPEQARADFERRYGTATDRLLPGNPFPITLTAELQAEYRTSLGARSAVNKCRKVAKVDDANFRSSFVNALQDRKREGATFLLVIGPVILLAFLILLVVTIRHSIELSPEEAQILTLSGAGRLFIATPYILFGMFFVAIGVALGAGGAVGLFQAMLEALPWIVGIQPELLVAAAALTLVVASILTLLISWNKAKY